MVLLRDMNTVAIYHQHYKQILSQEIQSKLIYFSGQKIGKTLNEPEF